MALPRVHHAASARPLPASARRPQGSPAMSWVDPTAPFVAPSPAPARPTNGHAHTYAAGPPLLQLFAPAAQGYALNMFPGPVPAVPAPCGAPPAPPPPPPPMLSAANGPHDVPAWYRFSTDSPELDHADLLGSATAAAVQKPWWPSGHAASLASQASVPSLASHASLDSPVVASRTVPPSVAADAAAADQASPAPLSPFVSRNIWGPAPVAAIPRPPPAAVAAREEPAQVGLAAYQAALHQIGNALQELAGSMAAVGGSLAQDLPTVPAPRAPGSVPAPAPQPESVSAPATPAQPAVPAARNETTTATQTVDTAPTTTATHVQTVRRPFSTRRTQTDATEVHTVHTQTRIKVKSMAVQTDAPEPPPPPPPEPEPTPPVVPERVAAVREPHAIDHHREALLAVQNLRLPPFDPASDVPQVGWIGMFERACMALHLDKSLWHLAMLAHVPRSVATWVLSLSPPALPPTHDPMGPNAWDDYYRPMFTGMFLPPCDHSTLRTHIFALMLKMGQQLGGADPKEPWSSLDNWIDLVANFNCLLRHWPVALEHELFPPRNAEARKGNDGTPATMLHYIYELTRRRLPWAQNVGMDPQPQCESAYVKCPHCIELVRFPDPHDCRAQPAPDTPLKPPALSPPPEPTAPSGTDDAPTKSQRSPAASQQDLPPPRPISVSPLLAPSDPPVVGIESPSSPEPATLPTSTARSTTPVQPRPLPPLAPHAAHVPPAPAMGDLSIVSPLSSPPIEPIPRLQDLIPPEFGLDVEDVLAEMRSVVENQVVDDEVPEPAPPAAATNTAPASHAPAARPAAAASSAHDAAQPHRPAPPPAAPAATTTASSRPPVTVPRYHFSRQYQLQDAHMTVRIINDRSMRARATRAGLTSDPSLTAATEIVVPVATGTVGDVLDAYARHMPHGAEVRLWPMALRMNGTLRPDLALAIMAAERGTLLSAVYRKIAMGAGRAAAAEMGVDGGGGGAPWHAHLRHHDMWMYAEVAASGGEALPPLPKAERKANSVLVLVKKVDGDAAFGHCHVPLHKSVRDTLPLLAAAVGTVPTKQMTVWEEVEDDNEDLVHCRPHLTWRKYGLVAGDILVVSDSPVGPPELEPQEPLPAADSKAARMVNFHRVCEGEVAVMGVPSSHGELGRAGAAAGAGESWAQIVELSEFQL
ncbi:hypothetical protein AMAG_17919 [Allomyces macrogynus ATCC 38327]|uniref:Ubiquitin carboxyl-terminal hydrolase 7 ICP0-binding domain-containing protein n=1 Tax=Allomyces macrogynus (strain ATCC 38327) TaxID=578462 RepID=A0A0L0S1Y6_ALLM3|nr:hypothetical protein AMAG_17919 [Allomyces macrogynus ATCC 38327]|eukprot:KNE56420.1 hypothetical protein AMAG_17919 [Allomyces macrogynus ATCC 38327]